MKKETHKRFLVLYSFVTVFLILIVARLYRMQIVGGAEAREIVDSRLSLSVPVEAPRGNIIDRYGRLLVKSKRGYFVTLEKTTDTKEERNKGILRAFSLLSQEEQESCLVLDMKPSEEIEDLCQAYGISDAFSFAEKQVLCSVYANMEKEGFSATVPYTLAEDVSMETVIKIKEQQAHLPSVTIQERPVREYLYPETAVHILGRVGKISQEELELHKDAGYKRTDYIGKQGAEKAFESILKGTDGIRAISKYTDFTEPKEAVAGDTVMLTLDLELQQAAEDALQDAVARTYRKEQNGAAAVVLDVHSGEVLASASYPTYDITTFHQQYTALNKNPAKPMFHRSIAGLYAPGSTFKLISAIAAIDSGKMEPEETIKTQGVYAYLDRTFQCNIFRSKGETHGTITLPEAIGVSCNYYFYELGRRTGIDAIAKTAEAFGLGEKTGIELLDEEGTGKIATPALREKIGGKWYPGDVLQAAIGQSDHLFTPISLANYAAALANGGTLYKTTLLKAVKSEQDGKTLSANKPEIKRQVSISKKALSAVRQGMELVTTEGGTAGAIFSDFPVPVAGKTGSAQVSRGTNGLFIGYAPAENPSIALCVVVENGGAGTLAAEVAKNIFAAYFEKPTPEKGKEVKPYTLLP